MDTKTDKFIPGPWEIEPKERRENPLFVMSSDGDRIARCDGLNMADFGPNKEQAKANARLIAAAPELLEACRGAKDEFDWIMKNSIMRPVGQGQATYDLLRRAIAKALEGKVQS